MGGFFSHELRVFSQQLLDSREDIAALTYRAAVRISQILASYIKINAPQFEGNLVNSIQGAPRVEPGRLVAAEVSSPLAYARIQDEGRKPGRWPPVDPIRRWVELKLYKRVGLGGMEDVDKRIDDLTFLVRRAIGRHGTKATKYIQRGVSAAMPAVDAELEKLANSIRGLI